MVNINFSDLSTPFKIRSLITLFLLFSAVLFAEDITIITQDFYSFKVNNVNMLSVKVINRSSKDIAVIADLQTNQYFVPISRKSKIVLKKNEPVSLYFSYFLNAQQTSQILSLPLILRNDKNQEIIRKYCFIQVEPYIDFNKSTLNTPNYLTQKSTDDSVSFVLSNQSNIPVFGEIFDDQKQVFVQYTLDSGQTQQVQIKLNTEDIHSALISKNFYFKNNFITQDSIALHQDSLRVNIPYYHLWEGDPYRFIRVPAFISNKVTFQENNNDHYWNHSLKMYAYGSLSNEQYLSFYLKKDNARYLNQWKDNDEYFLDLYSPKYQLSAGKSNYKKSELLSSVYGEGVYLNYLFYKVKFSLMNVNELIKETYSYRMYGLSYYFDNKDESQQISKNQYISFNYYSKRNDQNLSKLYSDPEKNLNENDKMNLQLSLNLNKYINFYNELMWVKETKFGDVEFSKPAVFNQLRFLYPKTQLNISNYYQNERISGEYEYKKYVEASLNHNFKDFFTINTAYRYQTLKSDYAWSYSYQQKLQSAYAKSYLKLFYSLYNVTEFNYLRYKNELSKNESTDDNYASGIAIKNPSFYAEFLYGKRDYTYFEDQMKEDYYKFNIRVNVSNQLIFNNDNKISVIDDHYTTNHYLAFDTTISQHLRALFSADYSYYQQNKWQNLLIFNTELMMNVYKSHQIRLSGRWYQYVNYHDLNSYSVSIEYILPLSVPVFPKANYSEIEFNLIDPYTSKPVKNALISANQYYAMTNDSGHASFRGVPRSNYQISIVNPITSFLTEPPIPLTVDTSNKRKVTQQIKIIESSSIKVHLNIKDSEPTQNNIYLNELSNEQKSTINADMYDKISLVLEKDDVKLIHSFNKDAVITFGPLSPGKWKLKIYKNDAKDKLKIHLDEIEISLSDNENRDLDIFAEPIIHHFESFENGGVIISQ